MLVPLPKLENESNRDYSYRILKENIIELVFKPGDKISEPSIATLLNLSRTPIREALILLENEGLVEVRPQKGTFVSKINVSKIENMIFIRKSVEKEVIRLACENINQLKLEEIEEQITAHKTILKMDIKLDSIYQLDNAFHKLIYKAVGAEKTWNTIESISSSFNRLRKLDVVDHTTTNRRIDEHFELLRIIKEQDVDKINFFVETHLDALENTLPILLKKYPDFFK